EIAAPRARMGRRRASRRRGFVREGREGADLAAHGYDRGSPVLHGDLGLRGTAFREEGLGGSNEGSPDRRADDAIVDGGRPAPRYCLNRAALPLSFVKAGSFRRSLWSLARAAGKLV